MATRILHEVTDEVLMLRFQRGDVVAFGQLVDRYQGAVYNFVLRFVRSGPAAEDILQEVLLRVVQNASDFKHEARFSTCIYSIARNLCIDHLRKLSLRNHDSFEQPRGDAGRSHADQTADPHPSASAERGAIASELRERITRSIEALPDDQREVFLLRELANLPFKEIAKLTDTPENTVKSRMRYALERLQEALREFDDTSPPTSGPVKDP